jgi:Family of unknown function (DUF5871)
MEYSAPVKVPDGRYYMKVAGSNRIQINKLAVTSFDSKPLLFRLNESQIAQVKSLEDQVVSKAMESSVEWFGREISPATIAKAFQSSLSEDTFETCLATSKGGVITSFWDSNKNQKDQASEWSTVDIIVELAGVWFLQKSFGPIFKVIQVKESKQVVRTRGTYLFSDDPSDDDQMDYLD